MCKAEEAGADVILVGPHNISQECYACGHVSEKNRVGEKFRCVECGHEDHADLNAAKIIFGRRLRLRDATL